MRNKQWSVVRGQWSEGGRFAALPTDRPLPVTDHRPLTTDHSRSAFTLVELLIVISILGLLSSMVLFALAAAQESARVAKTQSTIDKIHALLMQKFESYRTRRAPVDIKAVAAFKNYPPTPLGWARARVDVLRDLMRMELPDSFTDFDDVPNGGVKRGDPVTKSSATQFMTLPAVTRAYRAMLSAAKASAQTRGIDIYKENQSAECLYLMVTRGLDDPDVLEQSAPDEIGDTDGDGLLEFLDGWGRPIYFLRWAPAYVSPLQPSAATQHDPFDPMNAYPSAFPLFPLIYSAGPDGVYDITADNPAQPVIYSKINNDPFHTTVLTLIGRRDGNSNGVDESVDNITNHDSGLR